MGKQYIISDASKMLDIESHVLRYWEDELNLLIKRNNRGHRYYDQEDIMLLENIKKLKEEGLQLKAIKSIIDDGVVKEKMNEISSDLCKISATDMKQFQNSNKLKHFGVFIKEVFKETIEDQNKELLNEIKEEMRTNMQEMISKQEVSEEKRYKKLDETLREMQKMRQETAVSRKKRWFSKEKR